MQRRKIDPAGLSWYDPMGSKIELSGVHGFGEKKRYHRFPESAQKTVREAVYTLAGCTAGLQLRFRTNSRRIVIAAKVTSKNVSPTMAETGRSGFDLYTGTPGSEVYWNCAQPIPGEQEYIDEVFTTGEKIMRDFRINFPLYNGVESLSIALEENSQLESPVPLRSSRPVVIYGTSITQGGCASRPGSAFTNILSRKLQMEFLNYGFSGNGCNDPEVAELLSSIPDPAIYIIDSEANSVSAELLLERLPLFIDILRKKHPQTPILLVTKVPYGPRYAQEIPILKEEIRSVYQQKVSDGDKNIYFLDGSTFWTNDYTENTIDGAHPTDRGFALMAEKMLPVLQEILAKTIL